MVTRLVIAKLMQVGMKAGQKALRKKKSAPVQTKGQNINRSQSSNDDFIDVSEAAKRDISDKGTL